MERLQPGTLLTITYVDGRSEERVFERANGSQLTVRHDAHQTGADTVPREEIREMAILGAFRPAAAKAAVAGAVG